jgi:hypothetical protein
MERIPAADVHASGDAPDAQELILPFQQYDLGARFARADCSSDACTTPTNYNDLCHGIALPAFVFPALIIGCGVFKSNSILKAIYSNVE